MLKNYAATLKSLICWANMLNFWPYLTYLELSK